MGRMRRLKEMTRSSHRYWIVFSVFSIFGLLLLACSSQVPVSSPVGSAQVNSVSPALVQGSVGSVTAQETPPPAVARPETVFPQQEPAQAVTESASPAETISAPAEVSTAAIETLGDSGGELQSLAGESSGARGIVVSGSGNAASAPDLATLRLGVQAIAATVGEARTEAATAMTDINDSLQEDGVEAKDIQTGYFSIQPRYTGREVTRCIDAEGSTEEVAAESAVKEGPVLGNAGLAPVTQECFQEYQSIITGYEVSNNVTVLVRNLESIDDVIDGAVAAGGNSIRFNGLSFSLEDTEELEAEARAAAVAELEAKAAELASLAGVELGDLVYLTESGVSAPPELRPAFALERAAFDAAGGVSTPIAPGEVSVRVNVVGQYLIAQPE